MSIISRRKDSFEARGVRNGMIGFVLLVIALVFVGCDFHGPWDYYPEERKVYTGIYTYGYIAEGDKPYVCFSKVYELDENAAENFAFYDSAYVTVTGRFKLVDAGESSDEDSTLVLESKKGKPNCFESEHMLVGISGEEYALEAFFKWDSAGHTAKSRYKASASIPKPVVVKGLSIPKQDGSYEWVENEGQEEFTMDFLVFPMDMEYVKCALDFEKSIGGVLSILNYDMYAVEPTNTTVNKMLEGLTETDSNGYNGISMHDPFEKQARLGYSENTWVGGFNSLDTLYLPNMMLPIGSSSVDLYSTDHAYVDYVDKVKGSVSDSRVVPESNIENGMGVFFGMAKTTVKLKVEGTGVDMEYVAWNQCDNNGNGDKDSWATRACRLYQDITCSSMEPEDIDMYGGLAEANAHAHEYWNKEIEYLPKTCYSSSVKAAMMLDTTQWSIFLPDTISETDKSDAYGDGLKRYCVATNFKSNHIADCGELQKQCIEDAEKNNCKEYLWNWCADRNWDLSYEQCGSALVSRFYIEDIKSSILERTVKELCSEDWYSSTCKNWKHR